MRNLCLDDLFSLSEIADKCDLKLNIDDFENMREKLTQKAAGAEVFMSIFKKLHRGRDEVYALMADVAETTPDKVKGWSVKQMKDFADNLFKQEGVRSFFGQSEDSTETAEQNSETSS